MAGNKKQYKNPYTILEKVRKGEIDQDSYYDTGRNDLFSKLSFYKRPDLIKPHMHYLDEDRLKVIVDAEIADQQKIVDAYKKFTSLAGYNKIPDDKKPNATDFYGKIQENYKKLPKHMLYDVQKMYYHNIEDLDFEERDQKNYTKYKFLEKANNPVGKIMSNRSNLKSAIFTKNMILYYLLQMTMMEYTDPEEAEDIKQSMGMGTGSGNNGQGESKEPSQQEIDNALKKMMDGQVGNNMLDKAMQDAQQECKTMDQAMSQEHQERMFESVARNPSGQQAGKISPDYFKTMVANLATIRLSMGPLKETIKKLLDKSKACFSARKEPMFEDLFNAQDVSGLDEWVLLHPKLRKIFAEDIMVKDYKYVGKVDVYVDISGSMDEYCGVKDIKGHNITKLEFAKSFIAKMLEMDMLENLYLFDTRLKKHKADIFSVASINSGGGTTINVAVENIVKEKRNAIVITDAEDHCSIYSDQAFFIGVNGARFSSFNAKIMKQYSEGHQVVVFDGKSINRVDKKGYVVR